MDFVKNINKNFSMTRMAKNENIKKQKEYSKLE